MLRHAGESDGLYCTPCTGEQFSHQLAAAVAIGGHLIPVCRAQFGLHGDIQTAHDERYARFEHDLRRIWVIVDVEFRCRCDVSAFCCAATKHAIASDTSEREISSIASVTALNNVV